MWDLPGPGIKLVSPVSAGGFFTTDHQESLQKDFLNLSHLFFFFKLKTETHSLALGTLLLRYQGYLFLLHFIELAAFRRLEIVHITFLKTNGNTFSSIIPVWSQGFTYKCVKH